MPMPIRDLLGQKFGKLTVIKRLPNKIEGQKRKESKVFWECLCDCGEKINVLSSHLKRGHVRSCGCLVSERRVLKKGQKINRLTIINYEGKSKWLCICECKNAIILSTSDITSEHTKSCGCLNAELIKDPTRLKKLHDGATKYEPKISSARQIFTNYKSRDKQMNISFEQFLEISQQNCFYCGIEPLRKSNCFIKPSRNSYQSSIDNGDFIWNGLDRIDSSKSHIIGNVVACCWTCNRAKTYQTLEEFLEKIRNFKIRTFTEFTIIEKCLPEDFLLLSIIRDLWQGYYKGELSLSEFYYLSQLNCFYCDTKPSNVGLIKGSYKNAKCRTEDQIKNTKFIYNGLDRIDSTKGHSKDNVVPCCFSCNFGKSNLTLEEFQSWMMRAKAFQTTKLSIVAESTVNCGPKNETGPENSPGP